MVSGMINYTKDHLPPKHLGIGSLKKHVSAGRDGRPFSSSSLVQTVFCTVFETVGCTGGFPHQTSNPTGCYIHASLVGSKSWSNFSFLFFDENGMLHGVVNGNLYMRSPPTRPRRRLGGNVPATHRQRGNSWNSWNSFQHLFFMNDGQLYGVDRDKLYKHSPPTNGQSGDKWLTSSTLIGSGGWSVFQFLVAPFD